MPVTPEKNNNYDNFDIFGNFAVLCIELKKVISKLFCKLATECVKMKVANAVSLPQMTALQFYDHP